MWDMRAMCDPLDDTECDPSLLHWNHCHRRHRCHHWHHCYHMIRIQICVRLMNVLHKSETVGHLHKVPRIQQMINDFWFSTGLDTGLSTGLVAVRKWHISNTVRVLRIEVRVLCLRWGPTQSTDQRCRCWLCWQCFQCWQHWRRCQRCRPRLPSLPSLPALRSQRWSQTWITFCFKFEWLLIDLKHGNNRKVFSFDISIISKFSVKASETQWIGVWHQLNRLEAKPVTLKWTVGQTLSNLFVSSDCLF